MSRAFISFANLTQVGARDGLQAVKQFIPTEIKFVFLQRLAKAQGQNSGDLEATSFVSPKAIPQFSDSAELSKIIRSDAELKNFPSLSVLVLNPKGFSQGLENGFKKFSTVISPSVAFTQKNMGATPEEMQKRLQEMWQIKLKSDVDLRLYISTCFQDPFTKEPIAPELAAELMREAHDLGIKRLVISDTTGHGTPQRVKILIEECLQRGIPIKNLEVHFHDTYQNGLANSMAAFEMGITTIDSSAGGIGGCPYAPGAAGNLATEDLVWELERNGVKTGVNLEYLIDATKFLFDNCFPNQEPTSKIYNYLMSKTPEERTKIFHELQPYLYKEEPRSHVEPVISAKISTEEIAPNKTTEGRA